MRVSTNMRSFASLRGINKNLNTFMDAALHADAKKRVLKPSDDPSSINKILSYRKDLELQTQYKKNAEQLEGYLNTADSALQNINELFVRTKSLIVQGSNETLEQSALDAIADEISQIKEQIGSIANTKYGNKYVFGGISINTAPYNPNNDSWQLPIEAMKEMLVDVSPTTSMSMTVNGNVIFNGDGSARNLFKFFSDIENDLRTGNFTDLRGRLDELEDASEQVISSQASIGSQANRLGIILSKLEDSEISITEMLSKEEDLDMTTGILKLTDAETAYKSSLSITSKLMSISILDFIK